MSPADVTLSVYQARKLAKAFGIKLPRVGYETRIATSANGDTWLSSTGHFQFGWIGNTAPKPFRVWRYSRTAADALVGVLPVLEHAGIKVTA